MIQILIEILHILFGLIYFILTDPKGLRIMTHNDANWSVLPSVDLSGSYGFSCHSVGMDKRVICICVDKRGWETLFAWVWSVVQVFVVEYW